MDLAPGDVVAARYRVERSLGRGGMARVVVAHDEHLGRKVALKVVAGHLGDDEAWARRLRREGANAAALNHPNVVTLHDVTTHAGHHVLVMELVQGPTLAELVRDTGPIAIHDAVAIAKDVAAGLAALHGVGIVHRDLKPANILVAATGEAKIADLGVARGPRDLTATDTVFGTLDYVAPEQVLGLEADPRSDLYAFGCVLVELLTGSAPFTASTPAAVLSQHLDTPPTAPSTRRDDVPAWLDRLCLALLAKDPAARPQTARAVRAALEGGDDRIATVPTAPRAATAPLPTEPVPTEPLADGPTPPPPPPTRVLDTGSTTGTTAKTPSADGAVQDTRRGWSPVRLLVVTAAAVVVAAVAWAARTTPPTGAERTDGEETPAEVAPEPTASSPDDATTTPADIVADLRAALVAGRQEGRVSADGLDDIERALAEVVRRTTEAAEREDGDRLRRTADRSIASLRERLADEVRDGDLDAGLASALEARVDRLAEALGVDGVTSSGGDDDDVDDDDDDDDDDD